MSKPTLGERVEALKSQISISGGSGVLERYAEHRYSYPDGSFVHPLAKGLREALAIIDEQSARIAELEKTNEDLRSFIGPEGMDDLREMVSEGERIVRELSDD